MYNYFPIDINDTILRVKKLKFRNYFGAFEIWKMNTMQFILVRNVNSDETRVWSIDESATVNQEYIDKIITAIDSHYAKRA